MGSGDGSMGIWKDRPFWALFLGGLVSYLLGFEFTWAFPLGSFLWLGAFLYLTAGFLQGRFQSG